MRLFAKTESVHGNRVSDEPALVNDYIVPAAITAPTTAALLGIWNHLDLEPAYMKVVFSAVALWPGTLGALLNTGGATPTVAIRHAKSYGVGALAGLFFVASLSKADAATIDVAFPQNRQEDVPTLIISAE